MRISRASRRRREFLRRTLAAAGCGLLCPAARWAIAEDDEQEQNPMHDEFLEVVGWVGGVLERPLTDTFAPNSTEYAILAQLKEGWGKRDTAELLQELTAEHGDRAGRAVEKFLELNIRKDWPEIGKAEAHEGTEIEDFIRVLWDPLEAQGFEYTIRREGDGTAELRVTRCPVFELAKKTGMHDWLYHLACATDYYTTPSFSSKIHFSRTKTLMQGHDCCNHHYSYTT
jgi:predicted ArsR family transcriptional regulator